MVSTTTNNILIYCIFSFVYFQNFCIVVSWSPDAGLTPSMLDSEATITASSSQSTAGNIIDGDTSTFWQVFFIIFLYFSQKPKSSTV